MLDAFKDAFEDGVKNLYQKQANVSYFLGKYNASNKDGFNRFLENSAMKSSKGFVAQFIRQYNKMFPEIIGEVEIDHWAKTYYPCEGLFSMSDAHSDSFAFKDIASHDFFSKLLVNSCFLTRKGCHPMSRDHQKGRFRPKIRGKKLDVLYDWADASANPDIEKEYREYKYSLDRHRLVRQY